MVLATIEIFGPERCLFASNFPVDRLASDYDAIWRAFDQITADFSADERRKLFHDNAAHFYRLGKYPAPLCASAPVHSSVLQDALQAPISILDRGDPP